MYRVFVRLVPLAMLLLVVGGCGDDTPTDPGPELVQKVDEFVGTLPINGAFTHPFSVTAVGSMVALLSELKRADSDLSPSPVGFALGTWNGSICQLVLTHDLATAGQLVVGNASAVGDYCVRVYDATGTLTGPQTYKIRVEHY